MGIKSIALAATMLVLSVSVNATIVTHGFLTTDDTTDFILDTNTGRQYLRFDAYSLSYADTVTAISSGGLYDGWNIATSSIADDFYRGILGGSSTPCDGPGVYAMLCGTVSGWNDGDFGDSYHRAIDYFFFLSTQTTTNRPPREVGIASFDDTGDVQDLDDWDNLIKTDDFTTNVHNPINFLLYRDAAVVPVPATVWLFGSGLIGLIGVARRKVGA